MIFKHRRIGSWRGYGLGLVINDELASNSALFRQKSTVLEVWSEKHVKTRDTAGNWNFNTATEKRAVVTLR